jgi:hypothetical protein
MNESKIELNARKIRNGIRRQKAREQDKIWKKLSTSAPPDPLQNLVIEKIAVTAKSRKLKMIVIDDIDDVRILKGKTFDTVIINSFVSELWPQ